MDGGNAEIRQVSARIRAELRRDKKKAGILFVLLVTAGIVGGRLLVTHTIPAGAAGAPAGGGNAAGAAPAEQPPWAGGGPSSAARPGREAEREEYLARVDRTINRDLFRPRLESFPLEGMLLPASLVRVADASGEPGMFQQVEQWWSEKQDAQRQQLERTNLVQAQAQALSLQSVMLSGSPTALINGQVLRVGDWISGFRVQAITAGSCVVAKDGVEAELHLKP
jgi:hypothetical protein